MGYCFPYPGFTRLFGNVSEGNLLSESKIIKSWGVGCVLQALLAFIIFMVIVVGFVGTIILSVLLPITDS